MERYTKEQRIFIVEQYFKNNEGLAATVRNFRTKYGRNSDLTSSTVKRLIKKFRETGSISDLKHPGRPSTSRSTQNIEAVRESVAKSPGTSIRRRGQELDISKSSLQRILTKDLHYPAYKVQLTQELKPTDHAQRREFVECIMEQQQVDADFSNKTIFSDEAHFHLDGLVNQQNCRIWGSEKSTSDC
ncbi:DDB1- and CUL4-associated factor 16 isoform X2 [Myotis myotis]|uniref:DDB1- and CUL4-associated factor 16 isoform X2 n=1 Tax=Myotis myotis TaxID=51298 RepID=UPI0017481CB7|nr:DDB1- and CUL4-associated factor 16 isoform X2 [Myotis myotis]